MKTDGRKHDSAATRARKAASGRRSRVFRAEITDPEIAEECRAKVKEDREALERRILRIVAAAREREQAGYVLFNDHRLVLREVYGVKLG